MAVYQVQPGDQVVPGAVGVTELGSAVGGAIAGCGWAALAAVRKVVNPSSDASPQGVTNLIEEAVSQRQTVGRWAASGQATPSNIKYVASQQGITLMDLSEDQALQVAGIDPVEIGVGNARAFGGNDSNVNGHYITLLGRTSQGNLIVSDPNSTESTRGQLNVYTPAQLDASQPFWFGTVEATGAGSGASGGTGLPQSLPTIPPGFPGPIWNPGVNAGQAGIQASGFDLSGIFNAAAQFLANAAKRIGTFVIGFALVLIGLFTLFHGERAVQYVKQQGVQAAKVAAVAA